MAPNLSLAERRGRFTLIATILASSMAFIDGSALNVALADLQNDLGATGVDLLWIVNGYLLMLASLILVGGALGDHFGRKRIYGIGIGLFAVASLVCGLTPTADMLIGARFVQGVGGALMVPGSLAILSATLRPDDRGRAMGYWLSANTITTISGPVLGGFLADAGLWRAVFFINPPLAAIALVCLLPVPESKDESAPPKLDYPGAALTVIGLGAMTYGLIQLGDVGFRQGLGQSEIVASLVIGIVSLIAFVVVERRSDHPMVDFNLFESRTFSGANLMTGFLYGALSGSFFFWPLTLIQAQGYSESVAGFTFVPFSILLAIMSPWIGDQVTHFGPRRFLTVGPAIVGVGFLALSLPGLTEGPSDYLTTFFPGILLVGFGMGLTVAPLTTTVMGAVSSDHAGVASGINNAVARSAQVMALAIFGAIALAGFNDQLAEHTSDLNLTPVQREALDAEAGNLGDTRPPEGLTDSARADIERAIDRSFADTFRLLAVIAAAMCGVSAFVSWTMIEHKP